MRNIYIAFVAALLCTAALTGCSKSTVKSGIIKGDKNATFTCPADPAACGVGVVEMENTQGLNRRFFAAVMEDDDTTVRAMLKTSKKFLEARNAMKATPLHVASKIGKPKCIVALLEGGADVNAINEQGRTPLHAAATHNHMDIVKILIDKGAKVSPRSANLGTPLHDAAVTGNLEIAEYLVEKGADINATSKRGLTPVIAAATRDRKNVAQLLIEKGAKYDPEQLAAALSNTSDALKNIPDETFCCENL